MKRNLNPPMKRALRLKNLFLTACFLLIGTAAFSQEHTVTGVVTDSFKEPLIGVSIVVQGTNTGVVTGLDGDYSIQVPADATLEFSYVGMEKQSIKVGNRNVINVQMKEDSQMLAETVVIGYGSAKKRDLTGSITNIKGDEIANKPVANPLSALQGKVAGVQIINSGKAGADPEIRVRGTNSINGYKPLYVVDGLFNDNINFLNPQDIESMEILKDPSSLAIFGVRGANGVIIITTKKAKEGQTRVMKVIRNTTFPTGQATPTGRMKYSRPDSSLTTTSASQVLPTNIASTSVRAMLTNKETSSMRSIAKSH